MLVSEVYKKKLQQLTWDRMKEHLKAINGLKYNYIVYNYEIRKVSKEERKRVEIIMDLRRAQLKELKKRGGDGEIVDV